MKYLLEQKIGTITQQKWLTKLLGYNFKIQYKQGNANKVVDGLSRIIEDSEGSIPTLCSLQVSEPIPTILKKLRRLTPRHCVELLLDSVQEQTHVLSWLQYAGWGITV